MFDAHFLITVAGLLVAGAVGIILFGAACEMLIRTLELLDAALNFTQRARRALREKDPAAR